MLMMVPATVMNTELKSPAKRFGWKNISDKCPDSAQWAKEQSGRGKFVGVAQRSGDDMDEGQNAKQRKDCKHQRNDHH
jgi:hypothetical protein